MDLTTCVGAFNPSLTATGKDKYTCRGDRPDKGVSAMVRSATGEGNVPKADVTVYGGEDGFTSRMDLTTCVGALCTLDMLNT
ncbi:hypothetical protein NP493_44g12017 [Ridgeia piscesae]|uniref:Uncharacterized protein n=1 Tax=Ridgeia piscesae TaxID=27915 RepID=A0AAD9PBR0_RIDPI|nr:hypothetical protein NP493_44g12017 [Ridgeia piscesae]